MKTLTIKKVSELASTNDKRLLFCEFIDEFIKADSKEKEMMIIEQPIYIQSDPAYMAELACAVHRLSNLFGLMPPPWVFDSKFTLKQKKYAFDTMNKNYQIFLEETSLPEYRMRNLFYGEDVLKRC